MISEVHLPSNCTKKNIPPHLCHFYNLFMQDEDEVTRPPALKKRRISKQTKREPVQSAAALAGVVSDTAVPSL